MASLKILVVSDTHGRTSALKDLIRKVKPIDALIHAGDVEGTDLQIRQMADCPCTIVRGNNDYFSSLNFEEILEIGGHRIYVTHGHRVYVSRTGDPLRNKAKEHNCDIAVFGHTHVPMLDQSDDEVTILNPGSLELPRQEGRRPTYAIIEIDRFGQAHFTMNEIKSAADKKPRWFF